jgi:hypothetical protein
MVGRAPPLSINSGGENNTISEIISQNGYEKNPLKNLDNIK